MKTIHLSIAILMIFSLMVSCKSSKKISDPDLLDSIITLSTEKCFGKCAEYRCSIYENREMKYTGIKNTENMGNFEAKCSESEFNDLINLFEESEFSQMDDSYISNYRDLQIFELSFQGKSIKFHERKAPEKLQEALEAVRELIKATSWEKQ